MTQTEDEAKTKWCPFSRTGVHGGLNGAVSVNRHVDEQTVHDETRCLGPGCMAWRAVGWLSKFGDFSNEVPEEDRVGGPRGYCGIAGY